MKGRVDWRVRSAGELTLLYRLLYCLSGWIATCHPSCMALAVDPRRRERSLQSGGGKRFGLLGHLQHTGNCDRLANHAAASDRRPAAKAQAIQIAYMGKDETIQNGESHQQIVSLGGICIEYLNCLMQIANQSDCLITCIARCDRTSKITETPSAQWFERLPQVAKSAPKVLEGDRPSDTTISNSNRR